MNSASPVRTFPYDIPHVLRLRDRLAEDLVLYYSQEFVDDDTLGYLTATTQAHLGVEVAADTIRRSAVELYQQIVTIDRAHQFAWRMAGNLLLLRRGQPVGPWTRQQTPEWVPAQLVQVERATRRETAGASLTFRVLAGSPAGLSISRFWSQALLAHQRKLLGFDRQRIRPANWPAQKPFVPYEDPRQLFGLRLSLLCTPTSSQKGLDYERIRCTKTQQERNRRLLLQRARVEFACPYSLTLACHRCPIGTDRCKTACHKATFQLVQCPGCQRRSYFDPSSLASCCVSCTSRGLS